MFKIVPPLSNLIFSQLWLAVKGLVNADIFADTFVYICWCFVFLIQLINKKRASKSKQPWIIIKVKIIPSIFQKLFDKSNPYSNPMVQEEVSLLKVAQDVKENYEEEMRRILDA